MATKDSSSISLITSHFLHSLDGNFEFGGQLNLLLLFLQGDGFRGASESVYWEHESYPTRLLELFPPADSFWTDSCLSVSSYMGNKNDGVGLFNTNTAAPHAL